jgi:predicted porin
LWDSVKADATPTDADLRNWLVGVSVPVSGNSLVRAVYTRHTNKNAGDEDYNKFGIGFQYKLSKRTDIFTDYARISNSSAGTGAIGFSGVAGSSLSEILCVRHNMLPRSMYAKQDEQEESGSDAAEYSERHH